MRKLILVMCAFILLAGINVGRAQTTLPYSIDFGESQEGWNAIDNSEIPGTTWGYVERWAYIQSVYYGSIVLKQDYYSACDDYYVSPAFSLQTGKNYTIEFNACMEQNGEGSLFSVGIARSNSDMSTFTKLQDITLDDNSEYPAAKKMYLGVPSDGNYYIAFHSTSPKLNNTQFLFKFKLYEGDDSGETPEEVVVTVPYSVDLKYNYADWTAADNNGDNSTWTPMSGLGPMLGLALSGQHDDDYFSPKVTLKGGVSYKITTNIAIDNPPSESDVVTLTQGTDKTQMSTVKKLDFKNSGENVEEIIFTPVADGDYYFSFHNTSVSGGNTLYIYSFAIEEYVELIPEENEIYSTLFDEAEPLSGWTIIDSNSDGVKWAMEEGYAGPAYNGNLAMGAANDWLITPALNMVAGNDYVIRYTLSQAGAFDADEVVIKWGTTPTVAGMTNNIMTETIDLGSGSVDKVLRLTCKQSGNVYVGFNLTTADPNGIISLDKISVSQTSKAKPNTVEGLKVSTSHKDQTVTLNWTNPAFDLTQAPITEPLTITIYENGVSLTTLENRTVGEKDTYTYSPTQFSGKVIYRVIASIDGVESLPVEITVDLDDINGEPVLLQNMSLNTADDFAKWVIENKNGGTTWGYFAQEIFMPTNNQENHNDWAITPGVQLEPGKRYVVKFDLATSLSYAGNLKVWLGNAQTANSMTTELISLNNIYYNGYVSTSTPQFGVETAGTYYIGFQAGRAENGLYVKNVSVCSIEEYQEAPVMELPYFENFDTSTEIPTGWRIERSSDEYGFYVRNVPQSATVWMNAYSRPNALMANGSAPEAREEVIYTPKFSFEPGNVYAVSFMLNMYQLSGTAHNSIAIYKATAQNQESIVGEPLLVIDQMTGIASWEKKNFEITVEEAAEYCFAFKFVSDGSSNIDVKIDDFSIEKLVEIVPVTPAAVMNARTMVVNSNKSIIFNWNLPVVDVDGEMIQKGSVIKTRIYDGNELIAEPSVTMPDPSTVDAETGIATSYSYIYSDDSKFSGQKIYKFIPCIGDLEGPATTSVALISSFTSGYLKEQIYIYDFAEGNGGWTIVDNDKDGNTWAAEGTQMATTGKDEWLISPELTLTPDKSYYVLCEFMTDVDQYADITFTHGKGSGVEDQSEVIYSFDNVILSNFALMEIGGTFSTDAESNYFGIHVESENGSKVQVKNFKVFRLVDKNEPVALPYEEDFENRINIDDSNFTNKWGCRTSSSALFQVTTMPENTVAAHSGQYAVVAKEYDLGGRTETLYTPYFSLEEGKTYEISYYLYMPGNGENITGGQIVVAYTQDESGLELPVIQTILEPVTEWTKFSVKYTAEYTMDYCFYLEFASVAANAGIIAIDDFKIEEIDYSVGISQVVEDGNMYYAQSTATLYVPENVETISVFNLQGQLVMNASNIDGMVAMNGLNRGIYIVKAVTGEGDTLSLKVIKK